MDMYFKNIAALVGAATLASAAYTVSSFLYLYIRPSSLPRYLKTSDGSKPWAFITGASDGVGKAFAAELAGRGFNIILHGRNSSKLATVKLDLESRFPQRDFRIIVADASKTSPADLSAIADAVADIRVKILINNVGTTMPRGHEFDTIETYTYEELQDNVAVNATFHLLITRALMPNLTANEPSLILNIGSISDLGMPLFPAYSPAKAFLKTSTIQMNLDQRYKESDIEVMYLRILQVTETGTIKVPKTAAVPDGPTWVRSALARVGCGRTVVAPYFLHALQFGWLENMPSFMANRAKIKAMRDHVANDPMGTKAATVEKAKKEL